MLSTIQCFMLGEAAAFLGASLIHRGVVMSGFEHRQAGIAEGVIGTVLLLGLLATWIRPASIRLIGLTAQGFALMGTLVGVVMIAIGVGPRTVPDIVFHGGLLILLFSGLVAAFRASRVRAASSAGGTA